MKVERCDKCHVVRVYNETEDRFDMADTCNIVRSNGSGGMTPCNGYYHLFPISAKVTLDN